MTMLMKKTMKQTALTVAILFSLSGCALAAPARGKMNGHSNNTRHQISVSRNNHNSRPVVTKVVRRVKPVHHNKTVVVHDAPRVVHHYNDRYCDSDNTGTAIAAGLVGLILGSVIANNNCY